MTTEEPPRMMTASRWLIGFVVASSLFFGAIGGLAVLFVGDTFFEKTPDPAVKLTAINADIARTQQRIDMLEKKIEAAQQNETAVAPSVDTGALETEIAALKEKIDTLQTEEGKRDAGSVLLGLTRISTAIENDLPLQPGIDALKSNLNQPAVTALLDDLSALAREGIPSYADLETALEALKPQNTPAPAPQNLTWEERGKALLSKFVRVRPTHQVTYEGNYGLAQKALQSRDLPIVRATLVQFPSSPGLQNLMNLIDRRLRAEKLVRELLVAVTQTLGTAPGEGSLY